MSTPKIALTMTVVALFCAALSACGCKQQHADPETTALPQTASQPVLDVEIEESADAVTCQAYWEGWHIADGVCVQSGSSGCSNPFPFESLEACEATLSASDPGGDLCADFQYILCQSDTDCPGEQSCEDITQSCRAGSCQCNPETGEAGICTRDCRMGYGLCR